MVGVPARGDASATVASLDLRALVLAGVAAMAAVNPAFALRGGAVICAAVIALTPTGFRPRTADILAVCLAIFTVTSTLWTVAPEATALAVKNQLAVTVVFLAVRSAILNRRGLLTILVGYLAGCGYALVKQSQGMGAEIATGVSRLGIEGQNVNYLAYSLCTALALMVILWTQRPALVGRIVIVATACALTIGVLRTGTRGAEVSVLGLAAWLVWYRYAPRRALAIVYGAAIAASLAILTGYFDQLILLHLSRTIREAGDLNGRLYMWPYARRVFAEHLFTGTGAGTFRVLNPLGISAHNALLDVGTGLGVVGVCLLVGTLVTALVIGTSAMEARTRNLLVGSMVVVSAPIFLSGVWDQSPAAWVAIGLFSRIAVLTPSPAPAGSENVAEEYVP